VFGWEPLNDLGNVLALVVFAVIMANLSIRVLRRKLID
jgi:hypothetical protein